MKKAKVLIVDDSPFAITIIKDILEDNGYSIVGTATNMDEALKVAKKNQTLSPWI